VRGAKQKNYPTCKTTTHILLVFKCEWLNPTSHMNG